MYIELRKAGFVNKGAELMLHAVLQQFERRGVKPKFVMAPGHSSSSAPYSKRAELGFYQKSWVSIRGKQVGHLAECLPYKLRDMFGLVLDKEIDVVLDMAGFAYSDMWGHKYTSELARSARRWKKQGTKVVLLPQAFGPFGDSKSRGFVAQFVNDVDLVFARDETSYNYLTEICGNATNIFKCGDFTNLVEGVVPDYFDTTVPRTCVVPNFRMVDMVIGANKNVYFPFMLKIVSILKNKGMHPFILVHEKQSDEGIANALAEQVGDIEVIYEPDAVKIKGILGACEATIGSRYHGLVSALSQGVPSLATGWSHKYEQLFSDYDFDEGLLSLELSESELEARLELIIDPDSRKEIRTALINSSARLKLDSHRLWDEVFKLIDA